MKKALIIQYSAISHLNGAFKVAEVLQKNGYDVYYFIESQLVGHVQKHNFKYYIAKSHPIVEEYDLKSMKLNKVDYTYMDRLKDGAMEFLFDSRKEDLGNAILKLSPSIILADTSHGTDFALIYDLIKKKNIRFFYLETMLSSLNSKGLPYLSGKSYPEEKSKIFIEDIIRKLNKTWRRAERRIKYFGYDNYSLIKKEVKNQGIPKKYSIEKDNYMDTIFAGVPTLSMAPIELEFFEAPQRPYRYNLGFFINQTAGVPVDLDERLKSILSNNKKLIYVSFGTVFVTRESDTIVHFLLRLDRVMEKFPDTIAIYTQGKANYGNKLDKLKNIHVFKFVPQVFVLKHASIFITHGGLNSIKESIEEGVPMLAFPLDIDQIGNARKITYKNLGLPGRLLIVSMFWMFR